MDNGEHGENIRREELSDAVRALTERVARLEDLVQGLRVAGGEAETQAEARMEVPAGETGLADRGGPLTTGGMTAVFSRIATVSLILVLALVLRTLTDSGFLGIRVGSLLGIGYASLLEAIGWFMYRRSHPFAPIFSVSGALLLFSVVIETHATFGVLSSLPAYIVLIVAAAGLAVISRLQGVATPAWVGTVGLLFAGVPLDFPNPFFIYLAVLLLAANLMAFAAVDLPRSWWLRHLTVAVTGLVYLAWAFKIAMALKGEGPLPGNLAFTWFLPSVSVMTVFYVTMSFLRTVRRRLEAIGMFDALLPTLSAVWAYGLAFLVIRSAAWDIRVLGAAGVAAATALLGLAFLAVRTREDGPAGANVFAFPAAFLLAISFRDVSGQSIIALAILSWAALNLAYLSRIWKSSGVRVTSYFLQITVMGASLLLLASAPVGRMPAITIVSTAAIAAIAFIHYRLARGTEPPADSFYFTRLDGKDRSAAALLVVSLAGAFLACRAGSHLLIFAVLDGTSDAFRSIQSILINLGAIALFLAASRLKSVEVKMVAILVTLIGGGKVFLLDLLGIRGMPLVMSVLSFGLAAALAAVVLSRWQKTSPKQG
ncbi:MAG: hypothetical protein JSV26_11640 [bacterium]|nr:MAG: hypothetical protein JSV26_11640 [bacterium]